MKYGYGDDYSIVVIFTVTNNRDKLNDGGSSDVIEKSVSVAHSDIL